MTECPFEIGSFSSSNLAGVRCAKCTPKVLKDIVRSISDDVDINQLLPTIQDAYRRLKVECYQWTDCVSGNPAYPEYCKVRLFLEDAIDMSTPTTSGLYVSLEHSIGEQLKDLNSKKNNFDFLIKLNDVKEEIKYFQNGLSNYFLTLADFDKQKANWK